MADQDMHPGPNGDQAGSSPAGPTIEERVVRLEHVVAELLNELRAGRALQGNIIQQLADDLRATRGSARPGFVDAVGGAGCKATSTVIRP